MIHFLGGHFMLTVDDIIGLVILLIFVVGYLGFIVWFQITTFLDNFRRIRAARREREQCQEQPQQPTSGKR